MNGSINQLRGRLTELKRQREVINQVIADIEGTIKEAELAEFVSEMGEMVLSNGDPIQVTTAHFEEQSALRGNAWVFPVGQTLYIRGFWASARKIHVGNKPADSYTGHYVSLERAQEMRRAYLDDSDTRL